MKEYPALVGRDWIDPSDRVIAVDDPSNDLPSFAAMPSLSKEHVRRAVDVAAQEQLEWSRRAPAERSSILLQTGRLLTERRTEIVHDLIAEGGRPRREAEGEVGKAIDTLIYYGGLSGALDGRCFQGGRAGLRHETRFEPIGVTVAITPWNVPIASPARKLAPALLAGNAMILKPASATPVSSYHLVRALVDAGVPKGAVQLLTGSGSTIGEPLAVDDRVAALSFTGSTRVGLDLKHQLGRRLTRIQLELGGKNAAIVCADADLDAAVNHVIVGAFAAAGQQCTATSRVIVDSSIAEDFTARLVDRTQRLVIGATGDAATDFGPLIDEAQVRITEEFVTEAVEHGGVLAYGGQRIDRPGHYFEPTIIVGVTSSMNLAREEVFGPVLAILESVDIDDAIGIMNATRYGLSSAVHTSNLGTAEHVASRSNHGVVAINGGTAGIEVPAPFGGFGDSGTDSKEHGPEALHFYTRMKLVSRS